MMGMAGCPYKVESHGIEEGELNGLLSNFGKCHLGLKGLL